MSPVCSMNSGIIGSALILSTAAFSVSITSGFAGLLNPNRAVADLDEAKLTLSMLLAAVAVAKAIRLQDSALQHTQSARRRPSHALQKSPAVNSVAVVVNLDFIVIRC